MAKNFYQLTIALGVCALVLAAAYRWSTGNSAQTLAQNETPDTSICYMRLADGRQMDLRGICGKTAGNRPSSAPIQPVSSPLNDDDDESGSTGQTPSVPQPTPTARAKPTPATATPSPATPTVSIDGQTPPTNVPSPVNANTPTPAIAQPTPRSLPQTVVPSPEKRDE